MRRFLTRDLPSIPSPLLAAVLLLTALVYQLSLPDPAIDVYAVWTAGRMWSEGMNPYGPAFGDFAHAQGLTGPFAPVFWLYPPQWWALAMPLGALSQDAATLAFRWVSAGCILAAVALCWKASDRLTTPPSNALKLILIALIIVSTPMRSIIYTGQTGALLFLGCGLILSGVLNDRRWASVAGFVLLLMKPQFGLVVVAVALTQKQLRRDALVACALTATAVLPVLVAGGLGGVLAGVAGVQTSLGEYRAHFFNLPTRTTGLGQFAALAGLPALGTLPALAGSVALSSWLVGSTGGDWRSGTFWTGLFCAPFLLLPLHEYDLLPMLMVLLFVGGQGVVARTVTVAGAIFVSYCAIIGVLLLPAVEGRIAQAFGATLGIVLALGPSLFTLVAGRSPGSARRHQIVEPTVVT